MSHKFKSGDIVQLKSGGPKMTVAMVAEDNGSIIVHCSWFDKEQRTGSGLALTHR
jgi:uncharacterized protein YodC (DUF2158 family)